MYKSLFKRVLDFCVAVLAILLLIPIFIIVMLSLTIANRGNPFFTQERPGLNEKIFRIIKFKSMSDERDENGVLLPDNKRLTYVGKLVRKTSLDELPQLFNVLRGDMSLIGPRPLRTYYLPLYSEEQKRRHNVRPGITGWAQVNGRNAISWTEKFSLDLYYVNNYNLLLDLKILLLTVKKVVIREGIAKDGYVTTVPFNGEN